MSADRVWWIVQKAALQRFVLIAHALACAIGPSACQAQTQVRNRFEVQVASELRAAPQRAALLRLEGVTIRSEQPLIVQVFAVPTDREVDLTAPGRDYLGSFAAETGPDGARPRDFAVAVPLRLPELLRQSRAPLRVVLVPVDPTGKSVNVAIEVAAIRATPE